MCAFLYPLRAPRMCIYQITVLAKKKTFGIPTTSASTFTVLSLYLVKSLFIGWMKPDNTSNVKQKNPGHLFYGCFIAHIKSF